MQDKDFLCLTDNANSKRCSTYSVTHVHTIARYFVEASLSVRNSFFAFSEKADIKKYFRNNIHVAQLSFLFFLPTKPVLSDICVNGLNVHMEKGRNWCAK
jgi:hypothetical protein